MDTRNDAPPPAVPPDTLGRIAQPGRLARAVERCILSSRWLLTPMYLGLVVSLFLLLAKFVQASVELAQKTLGSGIETLITSILTLVDLSLMGNLLIIVMFAGYENFVSRFSQIGEAERPEWMGSVGFGGLKLKLMTSIIAIGAIHLLEDFMHLEEVSDRSVAWSIAILLTFVLSGALMAAMDGRSDDRH